METTHGKTHSENGEGECWWSRIASPYPDAIFFSRKKKALDDLKSFVF